MNRRKQVLTLLSAITMMSCAAACSEETSSNDVPQITAEAAAESGSTEVSQEAETAESSERPNFETTYEITEWDINDFKTIECCGTNISIPCKLSDIDERFEVKLSPKNEEYSTSKDCFELYFKNKYVGSFCYDEADYDTDNSLITSVTLAKFEIFDLTEKSTKDEVQKKLGKGNNIDSEYADVYYGNNVMIIFHYIDNDTTTIFIGC